MAERFDDGGPAFPHESYCRDADMNTVKPGMTLRDYFAAKAMRLAWSRLQHNYQTSVDVPKHWLWTDDDFDAVAEHSYAIADAMLKAREGGAA